MKTLTFIGTGELKEVTYYWQGRECSTNLFPEAIAKIFEPQKLFVFVTPKAKEHKNFCSLCERLGELVEPVDIPEGKSEAELWDIFEKCAEVVDDGDEILLDITHAFRSLPLIVFTVAAYLRRTKKVTIRHIVYGAYEARKPFRDPPQPEDRAPIFDLTPLLDLLDWLSGVESWLDRGDAKTLAEKIKATHNRLWKERREEQRGGLPKKLQSVASKLLSLSQALHLSRPLNVMGIANELLPMLKCAKVEIERWAKPFSVIVEQVQKELEPLAHSKPERLDVENLSKQFALIEHYLKKGLIVQAVTLAREWVVSWTILQRGEGDWLCKDHREEIESALGAAAARKRGKSDEVPNWFEQLPQSDWIAQLWDRLIQLRNDLAHCGMRKQPTSARNIEQQVEKIVQDLKALLNEAPEHSLWGGWVVIDLKALYGDVAKLDELPAYVEQAKELAGEGNDVVLTGQAPIWLYLAVAHALHGKARRLWYTSPVTGEVLIFDHSAR